MEEGKKEEEERKKPILKLDLLKYKHTMKGKNHDHLNKCREKLFKQKFNIHS